MKLFLRCKKNSSQCDDTKRPWPLPRHLSLLIWEMPAVGMPGSSLMGSSVSSTAASASSPVSPRLSQHLSPRYSQRPNSLGPPRPATDIWIPIPAQRPCSVSHSLSSTPASRSTSLAPRNASTAMQVRRLPLRCVSTDISTPIAPKSPQRGYLAMAAIDIATRYKQVHTALEARKQTLTPRLVEINEELEALIRQARQLIDDPPTSSR